MADSRALPSMLLLVIALLLAAILFRGGDAPPRPSRSVPVSTGRLEQVTTRLALAVEKLELALARQPSHSNESSEGKQESVIVLPALAPAAASGRAAPFPAPREIRPKQLKSLTSLRPHEREANEILREYVFRTYREILDEFGFPDRIDLGSDAIRFQYEFSGLDGRSYHLAFAFVHGIVMGVYY